MAKWKMCSSVFRSWEAPQVPAELARDPVGQSWSQTLVILKHCAGGIAQYVSCKVILPRTLHSCWFNIFFNAKHIHCPRELQLIPPSLYSATPHSVIHILEQNTMYTAYWTALHTLILVQSQIAVFLTTDMCSSVYFVCYEKGIINSCKILCGFSRLLLWKINVKTL